MTKCLVLTGCSGFIGLNFLEHFISRDHHYEKIVSIDSHGYATEYNNDLYLELCHSGGIIPLKLDINELFNKDIEESYWFDSECTFDILDFASESHVDNSINKPFSLFADNALLTCTLTKFFGIERISRFIHISTDEVYGELDNKVPYDLWFSTNTQFNPNNPYSASKLSQDSFLMSMRHTFNMDVRFIRMANQFGPHQHPEKMMPSSILNVLRGNSIKVYGTGENVRQWTPVVDTVVCIADYLLEIDRHNHFHDVSKIYNINPLHIAHKNKCTLLNNNEVVEIWREILENDFGIRSSVEYVEDRKGHDKVYALQTHTSVDEYFTKELRDSFRETIEFYIQNKERFLL